MYTATQIAENIYWVGAIDFNERNFHGYTMYRGTTYNAYLITGEKPVLIDTVKAPFASEMLERIASVIDPASIAYVIANHGEQDHSGSIPAVMAAALQATIIATPNGVKSLQAHYGADYTYQEVKSGDTLDVGGRVFTFVHTPMVHWPDNMVTYDGQSKILFSNDAFGQHYASAARFDDENDLSKVMAQAQKYYANIVFPYSKQASKAVEACTGLDIAMIAPAHGVIWRENVTAVLQAYQKWTAQELDNVAVIAFDSMYHETEKLARCAAEVFASCGTSVRMYDLKSDHISDVIGQVLTARYVCVGSPTLNSTMLPTVASFLAYLKGLLPKGTGRKGFAFGSYGWVPKGPAEVSEQLEACGIELMADPVTCQWKAGQEQFDAIAACIREAAE